MPSPPDTATKHARWPRSRRLLRRADFVAAYEEGMRRASRHFTIFGRRSDAQARPMRIGITASRKLGPAVLRNRIRRRTRELLRRCGGLAAASGCDIVINPRRSAAEADFAVLARELDEQLALLCAQLRNGTS